MSAITTTLLTFLRPGDVIVHSEPLYGGTEFLLSRILTQYGVQRVAFNAGEPGALDRAIVEATVRGPLALIFLETPANPTNAQVDIARCAEHAARIRNGGGRTLVVVDNTFLGPLWQHPLKHGADLVLYSLTKYVGGHSDLIAGAGLGAESLISQVRIMRTITGTMADPATGWLIMRSLETLKLRMTCQMKNARYVAEFLADHPKVRRVSYLGLLAEDDPQFELYRRQCLGPGSTFSFEVLGGQNSAFQLLNSLELIRLAVSLGGTESLAEHPATMTHADIDPAEQRRMGIMDGMVRLSVGVEHPEDLIADLRQALDAVSTGYGAAELRKSG
jgi:methionine-gamma-lyase